MTRVNPSDPTKIAQDPLRPGQNFRGYEILEVLGRGGMGVVYLAKQTALDRLVALKILPPDKAAFADFGARFEREAKALAALAHPNIVGIHDFGKENGLYFFVMEYVEGRTLRGLKLAPDEAMPVFAQICDALEYAHARGVVHRDIKPENILLDGTRRVRIADFGLAKLAGPGEDARLTTSGIAMGTAHYMPPEQMGDSSLVDARADIYSTGVLLYELVTGKLPVGAYESTTLPRLDSAILKALAQKPDDRYTTVTEFKTAVRDALAPAPQPTAKERSPLFVVLPIFGVILTLAFILFLYVARDRPKPNPEPVAEKKKEPPKFELGGPQVFEAHSLPVTSVAFHPKASAVATGSADTEVRIFDLQGAKRPRVFTEPTALISAIAYSPNGAALACCGADLKIWFWSLPEGKAQSYSGKTRALAIAFHPDRPLFAACLDDDTLRILDPGTLMETFGFDAKMKMHAVAFRGEIVFAGCEDGVVRGWEYRTSKPTHALEGLAKPVRTLVLSNDRVIAAGDDATIAVWDWKSGALVRKIENVGARVWSVAVTPDGAIVAAGCADPTLRVWNLETGEKLGEYSGHVKEIRSVAFSPDGKILASGSGDRSLRLWEVRR